MAAPSEADLKIEIGLESLRLMLLDLPDVAEDWPCLSDAERASWSLDWDQVIAGDLRVLHERYHSGTMTPEQTVRYQHLLREVRDALPTIERLNLYPPSVPLEAT